MVAWTTGSGLTIDRKASTLRTNSVSKPDMESEGEELAAELCNRKQYILRGTNGQMSEFWFTLDFGMVATRPLASEKGPRKQGFRR
jgi:hypothetical protein